MKPNPEDYGAEIRHDGTIHWPEDADFSGFCFACEELKRGKTMVLTTAQTPSIEDLALATDILGSRGSWLLMDSAAEWDETALGIMRFRLRVENKCRVRNGGINE